VEAKYRLTRGILEVLVAENYPGRVGILTKSPLVTRDIDLIGQLGNHEVGLTVTTTDDSISKWLEVRAPLASRRIEALGKLNRAGIRTYAFVGPLLPHFTERPELLDRLFGELAAAGVRNVFVEHINLKPYIRQRMDPVLESQPIEVRARYEAARSADHREQLSEVVLPIIAKHGLDLRLGEVLYHGQAPRPSPQPRLEGG
jgi:DNA repair photolyase